MTKQDSSDPENDAAQDQVATAAVLAIGDELLSGRTKDKNIGFIAEFLTKMGIDLCEARVVSDDEDRIVEALNELRARYTYVFTTGGIGPTHDDITADAVAKAFGVGIDHNAEAVALLERRMKETRRFKMNEARMRMARIPLGAELVPNSISAAPGFHIGNVFVFAGVPAIMQVMLDAAAPLLKGGVVMMSETIKSQLTEGEFAPSLGDVQSRYDDVLIGSYPWFKDGQYGTNIVLRSRNADALKNASAEVRGILENLTETVKKSGKRK
jgi:molybdenum cofactor synthesis domain-containing protein